VGKGPSKHHVHPRRVEAAFQRAFQHVAGNAGVFADQHRGACLGFLEHMAHRVREAQHKVGGNRGLAHGAADAVGAEILSSHDEIPVLFVAVVM